MLLDLPQGDSTLFPGPVTKDQIHPSLRTLKLFQTLNFYLGYRSIINVVVVSGEQRSDSIYIHNKRTLHFNEGWQEQTDVYVGYVMVVKFQVHREASLDEEGLLLSIFQKSSKDLSDTQTKKPSESQRELLRCSFPGPGPSSLTQDFWGSGDGCCYFRDHCLETTDGQPLPPLTRNAPGQVPLPGHCSLS